MSSALQIDPAAASWHLGSLDRICTTLARAGDLESMLAEVADAVRDIFDADRVRLIYPCDPNAGTLTVRAQSTRAPAPEDASPGPVAIRRETAALLAAALASAKPGTGADDEPGGDPIRGAGPPTRARLWVAIRPRDGAPWLLEIGQHRPRAWSDDEHALFGAAGERIADALTLRLQVRQLEHDLAERRSALAESEARFRDFAETAADWFWETDVDDRFVYFADDFREHSQFESVPLLGRTHYEVHADSELMPDADWEPLRAAVSARKPFSDFRIRSRDPCGGRLLFNSISGRPTFDAADNFTGYRGTGRDITNLVEAEQREQGLEQQLRQSQKLQAIGELTGGIAHDFNNILSSVLGYTELAMILPVEDPDGKLSRYLREIQTASTRARDLVSQMLTFSRGSNIRPTPTDVAQVVDGAVRMLSSTLPASVGIKVVGAPAIACALIDPVHLMQVTVNLCINARDALGGNGHIFLDLDQCAGHGVCASCQIPLEGAHAVLTVRDDGYGMDTATAGRMFDPFFSTKRERGGTGMGLAVVHGIVHEVGGHVQVESKPGEGTSIRVYIPLADREARPENAASLALPLPRGKAGRNAGARILVVDDEPPIVSFITEYLHRQGYEVTSTTDPRAAASMIETDPFSVDAVISDQTMPGLNGDELLRTMLGLRPDLPVILCSGYSELLDEERAAAMGARAFLRKPVSGDTLLRNVEEVLRNRTAP